MAGPIVVGMFETLEAALERRESDAARLSFPQRLVLVVAIGAASMALAAAGRGVVVEPVVVPTPSMVPTIPAQSRVLVVAESLFADAPSRGDIVTFASPEDPDQRLVKRIIGVEGERIATVDGQVTVNGKPLDEPWLRPNTVTKDLEPITVPPGTFFVLGDARAVSVDSRVFGPVPEEFIRARAGAVVLPVRYLRALI